jgi:hypothetical protein
MTASDMVAALTPLANAFDALGVPYYLGGSVASSAHGIARASLDADVVAALEPPHVDPLVAMVGDDYYIPLARLRSAVQQHSSCNFIHLTTMFKVDVFVRKPRPYDLEAEARARTATIDAAGSREFPFASPEDTVLAKLEWFRKGGETSERQWWDIQGVLRVTPTLDRAYLERWSLELGVADLLRRALADAKLH